MKIQSKYQGIKGFVTVYNRAVRYRYMITEQAKTRYKILIHWGKYGLDSTVSAFPVKRRTLFNWKSKLDKGGGKIEALNPTKRIPKNKRKRSWDFRLLEEIRKLRTDHPNLGAEKLHPLLLDFADVHGISKCPQPTTIERLIVDMGGLRTFPQKVSHFGKIKKANRQKVLRKPKDLIAKYPGHVMALDTIEKQRNGRRMYILTAIDIYSRTTFSIATRSHSSKTFAHFFYLIMHLFPDEIKNVLTDNGSEFKKYLDLLLKQNNITHYHTYPKTPKMNAHCESFNGTIQEEFVDYHVNLLFDDTTTFNEKMKEYVIFYNTKRVHCAFDNKKAPLEVLTEAEYYVSKLPAECKDGWGYSKSCFFLTFDVCYFHYVIYLPAKKAKASKNTRLSSSNEVKEWTECHQPTPSKRPKEARCLICDFSLSLLSFLFMLPRSKRLSVSLFTNVLANGKIVHSPLFTARILKTAASHDGSSRFSAVISKKIAKTAVERNKFRRRIYTSLSSLEKRVLPGFHIILMAKPTITKRLPKDVSEDLFNFFVKNGLIK